MNPETALCWLWAATGLLVIAILLLGLVRHYGRGVTPPTLDVVPPKPQRPRQCELCREMTATAADLCWGCHAYICPECNEEEQGDTPHEPEAHMAPHDNGGDA